MPPEPLRRIRIGLGEPENPLAPTPEDVGSATRHAWTEEEVALLGRFPDPEVARRVGVSTHTVFKERKRRKIRPHRERKPAVKWTPEMLARLGQDSDAKIAGELGLTEATVYKKRRQMGIASCYPDYGEHGHEWTDAQLALLGTKPDEDVATELKLSVSTVRDKRLSRGIPAFRPHPREIDWTPEMIADLDRMTDAAHAEKWGISARSVLDYRLLEANKRRGREVYVWEKEHLDLVGVLTDPEVAKLAGCAVHTVRTKREDMGLPPVGPTPIEWTPEMDALLGVESDVEVGRRFGISDGAVALRRKKKGIAALPTAFEWTAEKDALLGTDSDAAIGAILGLSASTVCWRRVEKGIPSITETRRRAEDPGGAAP